MIRTLVIDDEPLLRQYIKNSITTLHPDFKVIGEAGNGEEALALIHSLSPDVIFIDIKMPLLNGLEVLERCHSMPAPPLSIILSGYSDFSYAQKAIKNHAFDYILKPIDPDVLEELLKHVWKKIHSEFEQIQYQYFIHLLHNQKFLYSSTELSAAFSDFVSFDIYYICIGTYSLCRYNQFDTVGNFWKSASPEKYLSALSTPTEHLWILNSESEHNLFLIRGISGVSSTTSKMFATRIQQCLSVSDCPVTVIFGATVQNLSDFQPAFIDLAHAAFYCTRFSFSVIHDLKQKTPVEDDLCFFTSVEKKILHKLADKNNSEAFISQMQLYLARCKKEHCRQHSLVKLLNYICEIASHEQLTLTFHEKINELVTNSLTYQDILNGMTDLLKEIFHTLPSGSTPATADQIRHYIEEHYTEQISLSHLASTFSYSISYLSTLFKKTFKLTPNEYIIQLRMERARTLLSTDESVNIRQISELLGYSDPYYFSRLFKITTGCTPSEYRNKIKAY